MRKSLSPSLKLRVARFMQLEQIIIVFHVLIALAIIGLILLQQGKGADMGASFGSGSSQTVFGGAGGGSVLTKATAILAALFFVTSFSLAVVAKNHAGSAGSVDFDVPALVESVPLEVDEDLPEVESERGGGSEAPDSELPKVIED